MNDGIHLFTDLELYVTICAVANGTAYAAAANPVHAQEAADWDQLAPSFRPTKDEVPNR